MTESYNLIVYNKIDLLSAPMQLEGDNICLVSAERKDGIESLKEAIGKLAAVENKDTYIVADLIQPNDFVVLVTPIDSAAPKGRLILPQVQTIRDLLDSNCLVLTVKESELQQVSASPAPEVTRARRLPHDSKRDPSPHRAITSPLCRKIRDPQTHP
mgnify:CR=1 FL=1